MKINSIQIKIIILIIIVLFIGSTTALFISVEIQKKNLIEETESNIIITTSILNQVIRNIMLNGEAPIAVNTMNDLRKNVTKLKEIQIYRTDGSSAFHDYSTINFVNDYQNMIKFEKTERVNKNINESEEFKRVLKINAPVRNDIKETKEFEFYYPILNYTECNQCHGDKPFIRGIAHFKVSLVESYKNIAHTRNILTIFFIIIGGILLPVILILFIRRLILKPIFKIGNAVNEVGKGNFDISVNIKNRDELGDLSLKINNMIKGLKERFHLSKYVSKSTDNLVKKGEIVNKSEKKHITVLFSDIRGFTSYSEKNPPELVISNLNKILQIQSEIVEKFEGDIDKFVGDELMAIFDDEFIAVKCAYEIIKSVERINKEQGLGLHVGIGINSGEVIAGNIGSLNRLEYAVIGDTVNLGARLCSIAKANMILISESVNEKIKDKVETLLIENQHIKGKEKSINVFLFKRFK